MSALAPQIYNKPLVTNDVQYSQVLPADVRQVRIQCRDNYPVRYAYTTGLVDGASPTGPYLTLKAGASRGFDFYPGQIAGTLTFFFSADQDAIVMEIETWS